MTAHKHPRLGDPLVRVLRGYRRIDTSGRLYVVHYPEDEEAFAQLDGRIPHIEIGAI